MNILIIIPARGNSKGIPRKNLRSLGGKPLIYYAITTALSSTFQPDVYVSSDDEEILAISSKIGASCHKRDASIALDSTTLDPVIHKAFCDISGDENLKQYELVVTLQPTSPLLNVNSLDSALSLIIDNVNIDTIIAAKDDTHLTWTKKNGDYIPNYSARVNRQYLKPIYRETGAFLITRPKFITPTNRIGEKVHLFLLRGEEEIDIDTFEDWSLCEYYLKRKRILIVVSGYSEIGLGHVYNTQIIANDILDHEIIFLVDKKSKLAYEKINLNNYKVQIQRKKNLIDEVFELAPDAVINDILDTSRDYVEKLKKAGIKVINFEDLGEGARYADLVINAIYPEKEVLPNHYFGPDYYILRDEFLLTDSDSFKSKVTNVLLTFGGVDSGNLTFKVLDAICSYCHDRKIGIDVITGFGYTQHNTLASFENVTIHKNTSNISDLMCKSDIIFTSAGRTIYEIASLGIPAIVLAQNEREMTHFFANIENGFLNLGLGAPLSKNSILCQFKNLVTDAKTRNEMITSMKQIDFKSGRKRVQQLIRNSLEAT